MKIRRSPSIPIKVALVALLAGILSAPQASALSQMHERPSTVWGHVYAGPATKTALARTSGGVHLDPKSTFVVNYKNFPVWAKNDVQAAIDIWSANFVSKVPISVDATWGRSSSYGVLGSARPGNYFLNFANAPDPTLWYPSALANALAGQDLDKNNAEIVIQVNSSANWDQRNDGAPTKTEYDLESVFIHELGHGLGFLSTDSYDTYFRYGSIDQPTAYDAYVQVPDARRLSDLPSPSLELGLALTGPLVWSGPLGIKANGGVKPLLYSPTRYEDGSSVSHLDEKTYSSSGLDSVMTPNLDAGEVFQGPGPLLLAMMDDLRNKPPVGIAIMLPSPPRNPVAIIGDKSAVVSFDLPANVRTAQISEYLVKNTKTGEVVTTTSSPVLIPSLKNGTSYSFSITAKNSLGPSDPALTNAVTPQAALAVTALDSLADGRFNVVTSFRNQPAIVYTDKKSGTVKLALWTGRVWKKVLVDGRGGTAGRTGHDVSGPVSACISGVGTKQILHIFYSDLIDKDLRYATYDNLGFKYEIVDGNGPVVQPYDQPDRVRTASDVSASNACAITASGVQVFYRDESQGILLGAVKGSSGQWVYDLVDGDRKTDGRTTGDVAFHIRAVTVGAKVSVLYDSVIGLNQQKVITAGEIRLATRSSASKLDWSYQILDTSSVETAVVGYDVSLNKTADGIIAAWLTASSLTIPNPNQLRWVNLNNPSVMTTVTAEGFGAPTFPMSVDAKTMLFGCQNRLCAFDLVPQLSKPSIKFISSALDALRMQSNWVIINKDRFIVASIAGKLSLIKV